LPKHQIVLPWVDTDLKVKDWVLRLAKNSKPTAYAYASQLFVYWRTTLAKRFKSLEEWVNSVKEQRRSEDYEIQTKWAREVEDFILTRISPTTKRPLSTQARALFFWAIRSYLASRLGEKNLAEYTPIFAERKILIQENEKSQDTATITLDEARKLVFEANPRDRCVILCSLWGWGVGEFLNFAKDWYKCAEAIRAKTVPLKVTMTRGKTMIRFYTYLFDDAVESLHDLLEERERSLGRPLTRDDSLFTTVSDKPIDSQHIQRQIRLLAEKTGVEKLHGEADKRRSYRVRPHELGRDLFKTLARNKGVPTEIADFAMGHQVDPLKYDKSPWTEEGEKKIEEELGKLRPFLNLMTRRGKVKVEESYFEQLVENAALMRGLDPEFVKAKLLLHIAEIEPLKSRIRESKSEGILSETAEYVAYRATKNELFPAAIALAKELNELKPKAHQEVIDDSEIPKYLKEGWRFVSTFNGHHAIVEREGK